MAIKIGGQVYVPSERLTNPVPIDHVSFQAYDEMCRMARIRDEAVWLWEETQDLTKKIEDHSPDHPRYEGAVRHLAELQGAVTNACVIFLSAEHRANLCWQEVTPEKREELKMDDMFCVSSDRPNLYGLWFLRLPICEPPPDDFYMDEVALLIAHEPQRKVYERMRKP